MQRPGGAPEARGRRRHPLITQSTRPEPFGEAVPPADIIAREDAVAAEAAQQYVRRRPSPDAVQLAQRGDCRIVVERFDRAEIGRIMGVFGFSTLIGIPATGALVDRFGRRPFAVAALSGRSHAALRSCAISSSERPW